MFACQSLLCYNLDFEIAGEKDYKQKHYNFETQPCDKTPLEKTTTTIVDVLIMVLFRPFFGNFC